MRNLLTLLNETALRYPGKTAAACQEESYTFSQLQDLAGRLGRTISERAAAAGSPGKNQPVPVLVHRDAASIIAVMAVL